MSLYTNCVIRGFTTIPADFGKKSAATARITNRKRKTFNNEVFLWSYSDEENRYIAVSMCMSMLYRVCE